MKILVMNGPNINFLGIREKGIYGEQNYEALVSMIEKKAEELGVDVEVFQSNHEGDRKSTRLNSSHNRESRMPSSA